ncbi:37S ribosomal protein S17 mitochondrial [Thoreauomyces humboldtii]|nr:37S ribosomal protein S17 mitochondrial [Thoreauomyces humboldtii]
MSFRPAFGFLQQVRRNLTTVPPSTIASATNAVSSASPAVTEAAQAAVKPPRQQFLGEVVGTKMQKTIKVRVAKVRIHPVIQKPVVSHKVFFAHDAKERCVVGDYVRIDSCNKISKHKNFTLGAIIKPARRFVDDDGKVHTQKQEGVGKVDISIKAKEAKGLEGM